MDVNFHEWSSHGLRGRLHQTTFLYAVRNLQSKHTENPVPGKWLTNNHITDVKLQKHESYLTTKGTIFNSFSLNDVQDSISCNDNPVL